MRDGLEYCTLFLTCTHASRLSNERAPFCRLLAAAARSLWTISKGWFGCRIDIRLDFLDAPILPHAEKKNKRCCNHKDGPHHCGDTIPKDYDEAPVQEHKQNHDCNRRKKQEPEFPLKACDPQKCSTMFTAEVSLKGFGNRNTLERKGTSYERRRLLITRWTVHATSVSSEHMRAVAANV